MPITTSAIGLNVAIGIGVWMSQLPVSARIVLTAVLVGKFFLHFFTVWISDEEKVRKSGTIICIVLNIAIIIYSVLMREFYIVLSTAILLVALLVWSFAAIFDFEIKRK